MIRWVVGFLFDHDWQRVALIAKNRGPCDVAGRLNGIGGKIEPGETPGAAMAREFREETGWTVPLDEWRRCADFDGAGEAGDCILHVFYAVARAGELAALTSPTDEEVSVVPVASVLNRRLDAPAARNLPLLIEIARYHHAGQLAWPMHARFQFPARRQPEGAADNG